MGITFWVLLILGLGMLVRGLMTVARSRTVWLARSIAATATIVACRPVELSDPNPLDPFIISVRYADAEGKPHTAELPAAQELQAGQAIDLRFDRRHPTIVRLADHFVGTDMPAALIVFGGLLILMSFALASD
jgi:Protein of unknown function (DUF3592)